MTLNITLAARWGIIQSSDFRLTDAYSGGILSNATQKQIVLHYAKWSGLLTYTGIAAWGTHKTNQWLDAILTHDTADRSISQVVTTLASGMKDWLTKVPEEHRRHTFTLCTYQKDVPRIFVISTHQRSGGPDLPSSRDILVSTMRPRGPRTLITGQRQAVKESWLDELKREMSTKPDTKRLRRLVAETNRHAANVLTDRNLHSVSETCVVSHLLPDGSGEFELFGKPPKPFIPTLIVMGNNMAISMKSIEVENFRGPRWLHGATWNRNGEAAVMIGALRKMSNNIAPVWRDNDC